MACTRLEIETIEKNPNIDKIYKPTLLKDGRKGVDSIFYNDLSHISWYSLNNIRLKGISSVGEDSSKSIMIYKIESSFHYLLYTYLDGVLPAMAVKPEYADRYRIKVCRNVPSRIVDNAVCKIDNSFIIQEISSQWLNINPEFFGKIGHKRSIDRGAGHTAELQNMNTILPQHKLNQMQPWFYSMSTHTAFPIYRLTSQSDLIHEYTYNLDLSRILQMEVLENDRWVKIVPDLTKLLGVPQEGKIPAPNLHACIGMIRNTEIKYRSCDPYRMFTESVSTLFSDSQMCGSQNKTVVKLKKNGSCKAIFWGAINTAASDLNIHSNYTTSLEDFENGLSPVKDTTLVCKSEKFKDLGGNHTSGPTLYHHFPCCPSINGLNAFSFCADPTDINANVGVLLGEMDAEIQINLQDPDCERWKSGNIDLRGQNVPPKCSFPFMVVVCMLMQKEFKIEDGIITDVFDNIDSKDVDLY